MTSLKMRSTGFLLILIVLASVASAQSIPELSPLLESMAAGHYKPSLTVGMGSFTYADTGMPTPFARWIEDELRAALTETPHLKLFDKQVAAAMDPSIRAHYEGFFGEGRVDCLLYGSYAARGSAVEVRMSLTDLGTGQLIAERRIDIDARRLPEGMGIEPTLQAIRTAEILAGIGQGAQAGQGAGASQGADQELAISMSTDRGSGAVYRDGERLTLFITSNRDAWLKLYHVDARGVAQLIWPNRFGGSGRIAKGEAMRFPAVGDRFVYKLGAPYGTEYIKAIASISPFSTLEPDFSDLAGPATAAITRGLSVVSTAPADRAAALVVYEITP